MTHVLRIVFFLSGCAALLFETLWFRQAGLMLGNSVWSSSIVLASFMAGLALGNLAAARLGSRARLPVRAYAALEGLIALSGLGLVMAFPHLTRWLAPVLSTLVENATLLNASRLAVAFALLLVPASAMGATLPLLVAALGGGQARFGPALGQLYGWNTLGAVAGALAGEMLLIERFGLTGTGAVAASLNLVAALAATRLAPGLPSAEAAEPAVARPVAGPGGPAWRLMAAAAISGGLLLALEVIWFRFILLFTMGTTATFAIMLAVVLAGIGLGGLLGSAWLRRDPAAARALPLVALLAGASVLLAYATFSPAPHAGLLSRWLPTLGPYAVSGLRLMLPTSLLSGLLFTLLGQALRRHVAGESRPAGLLTLANTAGAMLGALVGGILLLPRLGLERSFLVLGGAYGLVALLCAADGPGPAPRVWRRLTLGAAAGFGLVLALFPHGRLDRTLTQLWKQWGPDRVVARREGLTETVAYLASERWGQPVQHRLVTNNYSMSSTSPRASRYMRLFAYLPLALRPGSESAVVISFGLGSTLDALTEAPGLRSIDVVDISRDILELGRVLYPPPRRYPLDDPRVRVHVEDGRFFLLTTRRQFDLVTAEPPPPKCAGIVNLYSKEYFQLVRARLRPGGLASYWLPVVQLTLADTRTITQAFCAAFEDCSLWTGWGTEWMLVGSHRGQPPDEAGFGALWREPRARASLEAVGFARPDQLGATFLADSEQLRTFLGDTRPLEDDFPLRLTTALPETLPPAYGEMMDPMATRRRFEESAWVRRMWPPGMREATLARFEREAPALRFMAQPFTGASGSELLAALAGDPASRSAALWMQGSSAPLERAAREAERRGLGGPELERALAASDFADGRYVAAQQRLEKAGRQGPGDPPTTRWQVLALALAGEHERAARLVREAGAAGGPDDPDDWRFLIRAYGLPDPWGLAVPRPPASGPGD